MTSSRYGVDEGDRHYYFLGKDEVYSALAGELGLEKEGGSGKASHQFSGIRQDPLRSRLTVQIRKTGPQPAGASKYTSRKLWCATAHIEEAMTLLLGKTYGEAGTITKVYISSGGRTVS
jgi:hypothetical protein